MIDSQMDDMIKEKLALKQQIDSLEQNLSNQIKEKESLLQTFTVLKNESKEKENFGKRFVPQQELSAEQAFWLQTSHPDTNQSNISPVKIEAPKELPKDKSCNNQNALEILEYFENNNLKAQLQAKDTTISKLKEHIIPMRENDKEEKVKQEMDETE
ncbi:hypothetical protein Tco_0054528 [Tanacetum coccineum]